MRPKRAKDTNPEGQAQPGACIFSPMGTTVGPELPSAWTHLSASKDLEPQAEPQHWRQTGRSQWGHCFHPSGYRVTLVPQTEQRGGSRTMCLSDDSFLLNVAPDGLERTAHHATR